ncbi:MAG: hypothetical protein K0S33_2772 [Bacteroidetes bacterium]|nr:hypothetical protein [Bacteroidota bacterium]
MPNSAPAALPDSMPFRLVFKISDVPKLAKIYIQVGTTVDNGSILTRELSKIQRGDEVFLQGAGENFKIWNTSGYYLFKLPKNLTGIKWLTIYAKDAQGKLTKKEHFKF